MRYGPGHFDSRAPGWLAAALRSGEAGRHPLARGLCGRGNRRDARGRTGSGRHPSGSGPRVARRPGEPGPVAAYTHVGKGDGGNGQRGAGRAPAGSTSGRRGAAGTVTVPAPGTAGGRRPATWSAVRRERPPDSTTAPGTGAGPGGNTDAPATPTGVSAAASLAWDGVDGRHG